jgi:uncharacterized SAM-binding protein YcdF (DUF218 family)
MRTWIVSDTVALTLFVAFLITLVLTIRVRGSRLKRGWKLAVFVITAVFGIAWLLAIDPYDLRKLVGACLMPAGVLWLALLGFAWRLASTGHPRLSAAAWTLWLGLTLTGNVWVARGLMVWLERDYTHIDPMRLSGFDAVMVLGGGVGLHDHGQICLGEAGDRVMLAARLYHAGKAERLVTSGRFVPDAPDPVASVPAMTSMMWQDLGVPAERVVLLEGPTSTSEEIEQLAQLLAERSWQRVGLITSAYHLRRTLRLCRRHGISVTPLPANFMSTSFGPTPMNLIPQSDGFRSVQKGFWEILGAAVGR